VLIIIRSVKRHSKTVVAILPTLLYGSEFWRFEARHINAITAAELRYFRTVKDYTGVDHTKNQDYRKELTIQSV
jgi:hypothetical protein